MAQYKIQGAVAVGSNAQAQILFEAGYNSGNIYEFTPGGVQSLFASGLYYPTALAFQGVTLPVPEPSALGLLAVGVTAVVRQPPPPQQRCHHAALGLLSRCDAGTGAVTPAASATANVSAERFAQMEQQFRIGLPLAEYHTLKVEREAFI